jgi:hypothetical protein
MTKQEIENKLQTIRNNKALPDKQKGMLIDKYEKMLAEVSGGEAPKAEKPKKERKPRVAKAKVEKEATEVSPEDEDCDDLRKEAIERKARSVAAAEKRKSAPKKTEATKNKEAIEKASSKVEKSVEKRIKKGNVSVSEIEALIEEFEDAIKELQKLLQMANKSKMERGGSVDSDEVEEIVMKARGIKDHHCGCNDKMAQGGSVGEYVVVSESKDGYFFVMSKPVNKQEANKLAKITTAPRNEVIKVMLVSKVLESKKVIGKEYLMAKGGWTTDHRYLNKDEDYEVSYAKNRSRKSYSKMGSGGSVEDESLEMINSQTKSAKHHIEEFAKGGMIKAGDMVRSTKFKGYEGVVVSKGKSKEMGKNYYFVRLNETLPNGDYQHDIMWADEVEKMAQGGGVDGLNISTGVFDGKELWRITHDSVDGIGIYPKKFYTKEEAKNDFKKKYLGKMAQGGGVDKDDAIAKDFFTDGGLGEKYVSSNKFDSDSFKSDMLKRTSTKNAQSAIKLWGRELGMNVSKYIDGDIIENTDFTNDSTKRAKMLFDLLNKKMAKGGGVEKYYAIIHFANKKPIKRRYHSVYKAFSDYEDQGSTYAELFNENGRLISAYPVKPEDFDTWKMNYIGRGYAKGGGVDLKKEDIEIIGVSRNKINEKEWASILRMARLQDTATYILKDEKGLDVKPQVQYTWYVKNKMAKGGYSGWKHKMK